MIGISIGIRSARQRVGSPGVAAAGLVITGQARPAAIVTVVIGPTTTE